MTDLAFKAVSIWGVGAALAVALVLPIGTRMLRPGLSRAQIEAVMRAHAASTITCWVGATHVGSEATTAPVRVYVTIDGTGRVSEAIADGTSSVGSCLAEEVFRWDFPATGTTIRSVALPFKFVDP